MARPHKCREVRAVPAATAFRPCGRSAGPAPVVHLRLDELEAIRLSDLEGLYHDDAAQSMGVSRATFGRLIAGARHKVADALANGKGLTFQGGTVTMIEERTFICDDCGNRFQVPFGTGRPAACPSCQGDHFHRVPEERGHGRCCRRRFQGQGAARTAGLGPEQEDR